MYIRRPILTDSLPRLGNTVTVAWISTPDMLLQDLIDLRKHR